MNSTLKNIIALGIFLILVFSSLPGMCQLQHGGKPFEINDDVKSAEILYLLSPPEKLEIESALLLNSSGDRKALTFALERSLDLSPHAQGSWVDYKDYRVWRVHIISPEAKSLGVIFNPFRLAPGVNIFLYDPDRNTVKGSFNSENNKQSGIFSVGHIPGEEIIVEMHVPKGLDNFGELNISSVSHGFLPMGITDVNICPGDHNCSEACEIDVNCSEGDSWKKVNRSVVRIQTTTQYCTGVLINNTAYDEKPYVLSVEHCINTPSTAASAVILFNYESPGCFGEDGSSTRSISGSNLKAVGNSIDFSLIELSLAPPVNYNAYYAGWDLTANPDKGVTTIHHPMGDVKKISFDYDNVSTPQSIDDIKASDLLDYKYDSFWWIHQWDVGTTEPGSSGAPLFNQNQRVIGMLSGGRAKCGSKIGYDPDTDRDIFDKGVNINDYYTKLNVAWDYYEESGSRLKEWLDPLNTGLTAIDGYNPVTNEIRPSLKRGKLHIYPNPANDQISVSGSFSNEEDLSFSIIDMTGRLIHSGQTMRNNPFFIQLPEMRSGIYMIRVFGNKIDESLRFIIE